MTAGKGKRLGLLALCLSSTAVFTGLALWQVQRLGWKRDLIARVDARVHAPPGPLPARSDWPTFDAHEAE